MTDQELAPTITEANPQATPPTQRTISHRPAVDALLAKLAALAPTQRERRGQYLRDFFSSGMYRRRPGERLAEWIPRWEEGIERLARDGVDYANIDDLPGFFFLGIASSQRQG